ncbi:MAG: tail-specific protease [Candidatus Mcinerneyibacterium aminivorans]|uniref:Tail-specific protease n=1 Tax=Candidatus Mcinerneyibacterium aminivorans TaxID=2703815 RepID=A0A5D0MHW2_9BACT|nr:MAG: tail-specific protease [Candidatus Mcinerneyibacterium aminivorans]
MKLKRLFYTLIVIVLLFNSCSAISGADTEKKNKLISKVVGYSLEKVHYTGKKLNDETSKEIFNEFIKNLDYNKRYFYKSDIENFKSKEEELDDILLNGNFKFIYKIFEIYQKRLDEASAITKEILRKDFDFKKDEKIQLDGDKREYSNNKEELKDYWRKYLKYRTVVRYLDILEQKKSKKEDIDIKSIMYEEEIEQEAREKVKKAMNRFFKRMKDMDDNRKFEILMNSVAAVYDVHSSYFSPHAQKNFDLSMSGKFEGIGAVLTESEGNIKVVRIVPGGPAWKQGELEAEDVILKVASKKGKEPVSVIGSSVTQAVKLIRGKKGTTVVLMVRKPDGRIMEIPIERNVVILKETYAKSALIKNINSDKKYGYIELPKFYHDFNDKEGRKSSEDVKNELLQLKKENVDGLILDLRNNSGGALGDAVKTAGLFIKEGPIVQVRSKDGEISILRDYDPNMYFKKPVVILVNKFSASASEIVAAALKDYNRAVIVGSEHTFGKGTVQNLMKLDNMLSFQYKKYKPLGALKVTTEKFYRITGKSTQYKGVSSDIILPDMYSKIKIGEKMYDNSLGWDEIKPADFNNNYFLKKKNLVQLKKNSLRRIDTSKQFKEIEKHAEIIRENRENTNLSLNLEKRYSRYDEIQDLIEKYEKINLETREIEILNKNLDSIKNKEEKERKKDWYENLNNDVYIIESTKILNDLVK